jgi:glycosyltransferase involved in cell wall biosynthesis
VRNLAEYYGIALERHRLAEIPHGLQDLNILGQQDSTQGDENLQILFVGRFEERKGIDVLLDVLPDIMARHPEVSCDLVGAHDFSPFWADFTTKYASEPWFGAISAPGFISREDLAEKYRSCDIFVAPSRYESFGLIYLEAMMWEKPCIGTTAGGIPEVVRDKVTGLTVAPGSVEELQEALATLLEQGELRKTLGEKAREVFLQEYTDVQMTKAIESTIINFIQQKPNRNNPLLAPRTVTALTLSGEML